MRTLRAHAEKATRESSVEQEIRTMLELRGWRVHKIDVMRGVTVEYGSRGKRRFTEGFPGQPDMLAVRPDAAIYIECKRPKGGRLSTMQAAAHAVLRRDGFTVIVARCWEDVVSGANKEEIHL